MPKILSVIGRKGSGKSQALEEIIAFLSQKGHRVGVIKRLAKDDMEIDQPGKDTFRYRIRGAETVMLLGRKRLAVFSDLSREIPLETLLLSFKDFDLVFLEDYILEHVPALEIYRKESGEPPFSLSLKQVFAVCSDDSLSHGPAHFSLREFPRLVALIEEKFLTGCGTGLKEMACA